MSDARGRGEDQKQEGYPNDEAKPSMLQGTDAAVIVELLLFHYYLLPFVQGCECARRTQQSSTQTNYLIHKKQNDQLHFIVE